MNTPLKVLSLALSFLIFTFTTGFATAFTGEIVRVLDGDTIEVLVNKEPIRVRLANIDCPEKKQPYGSAAKKYVLEVTAHEIVTVESGKKDRYGRTIGEVILSNGSSLNRLLLSHGYAWHYKKYSKDGTLAELEDEARKNKVGLWQDKNPIAPWDWRRGKREKVMATKREEISLKEALHTEILINQALIDLLVTKGIITQEELMERIQVVSKEQ